MSVELIKKLNSDRRGSLHWWIEALHDAPRIAWYPSAGSDFRDLLFLHPELHQEPEPAVPDFFLHTDYWMNPELDFSAGTVLLDDGRTTISIVDVEELPRLDLSLDPGLMHFPEGTQGTGRILFMRLLVQSTLLGTFERPLLYAFVENAAFVGRIAWPAGAVFSHLIHVRYGGCFGGSKTAGGWLQHTLTPLGVELLISDGHTKMCPADDLVREFYPEIWRPVPALRYVRTVPSESWSNHGDVKWLIVGRDMSTSKKDRLTALAKKRKDAHLDGYSNLGDLADGVYDCDFVSPYTKTAGNFDSGIFVFLQDLSSENEFAGEPDPATIQLGYTPSVRTNRVLIDLLQKHFGKKLKEIYATNLFPLIKPGHMSARIPRKHLTWAAKEFALPQLEIVRPRLAIVLGMAAFSALCVATDHPAPHSLSAAIDCPIDHEGTRIWCQSHTGWVPRHRGSWEQVHQDWQSMADWYRGDV